MLSIRVALAISLVTFLSIDSFQLNYGRMCDNEQEREQEQEELMMIPDWSCLPDGALLPSRDARRFRLGCCTFAGVSRER